MPILPHDMMVSESARERWLRWRSDLKNAERKARKSGQHPSCYQLRADVAPEEETEHTQLRQRHTHDLLRGETSLSQTPPPDSLEESLYGSMEGNSSTASAPCAPSEQEVTPWENCKRISTPETIVSTPTLDDHGSPSVAESSRSAFVNSTQKVPTLGQLGINAVQENDFEDVSHTSADGSNVRSIWADGADGDSGSASRVGTLNAPGHEEYSTDTVDDDLIDLSVDQTWPTQTRSSTDHTGRGRIDVTEFPSSKKIHEDQFINNTASVGEDRLDHITDTVGAIAIDGWGRIACGASSGGIGMKYRGRVGPAALVGVGAAVVPVDPDDSEQVSVATVTSGTGEHMATTMAAMTCAERLYQSVKKEKGGTYAEVTEDEAIKSMIENEFMGHASVKNSNSAAAIGILSVKKTRTGIQLFYGHNTDSFALASMSSDDDVPRCTMSRSKGNGQIAQGGRIVPYRSRKRTKVMPRQRQAG
jgi:taspase (threonine aspartase 1)